MAEALDPSSSRNVIALDALAEDLSWLVPAHFLVEVVSALRGRMLGRAITVDQFEAAVAALARAEVDEHPIGPLLPRMRQLAANATAYDAAYVALAEQAEATLLTMDAKLARVPGARCAVRVMPPAGA